MSARSERLKKLVDVQAKLKDLHEMRRAGFVARAAAAGEEAAEIAARFDRPGTLADLFPDLYARRVDSALRRRNEMLASARVEAGRVATATLRSNIFERNYREAVREEERKRQDRETLEAVERTSFDRGD